MSIIFNMSLMAVPLIAAIAAIRFFAVYKLPKRTFYVMWGILLYQLFIPFNLLARLDISGYIINLTEKAKEIFIKAPEITNIPAVIETPVNTADK